MTTTCLIRAVSILHGDEGFGAQRKPLDPVVYAAVLAAPDDQTFDRQAYHLINMLSATGVGGEQRYSAEDCARVIEAALVARYHERAHLVAYQLRAALESLLGGSGTPPLRYISLPIFVMAGLMRCAAWTRGYWLAGTCNQDFESSLPELLAAITRLHCEALSRLAAERINPGTLTSSRELRTTLSSSIARCFGEGPPHSSPTASERAALRRRMGELLGGITDALRRIRAPADAEANIIAREFAHKALWLLKPDALCEILARELVEPRTA